MIPISAVLLLDDRRERPLLLGCVRGFQPVQDEKHVQGEQFKPAVHGIGNAVIGVKYRLAGLRGKGAVQ